MAQGLVIVRISGPTGSIPVSSRRGIILLQGGKFLQKGGSAQLPAKPFHEPINWGSGGM